MNKFDLQAFADLVTRITRLEVAQEAQTRKIERLEAELKALGNNPQEAESGAGETLPDETIDKWFNGVPDPGTKKVKLI